MGPRAHGPWPPMGPRGSYGRLQGPPLGSHGDPMGSNLGIPGFPLGIPRLPQGSQGSPQGSLGCSLITPGIPGGTQGSLGGTLGNPRGNPGIPRLDPKGSPRDPRGTRLFIFGIKINLNWPRNAPRDRRSVQVPIARGTARSVQVYLDSVLPQKFECRLEEALTDEHPWDPMGPHGIPGPQHVL